MKLLHYIEAFAAKNVLVIGDIMLDKYILGKVKRISPEAPIPVLTVEEERYVPGGAANAAHNITTLGAGAHLLGVAGKDPAGEILVAEAKAQHINTDYLVFSEHKPTTQKIRAIGNRYQLLRIDYENRDDISDELPRLIESLERMDAVDAIIVSDYDKGTITPEVMAAVKAFARKRDTLLLVDPKPNHKSLYQDVTLITPNRKEAAQMSGIQIETTADIEAAGQKLMTELNCNVLITRGAEGMSLFKPDDPPVHIPTQTQEVFDVSGAGDTVIATTALALCSGASLREAAILANHAAGIKVGKLGTTPVKLEALLAKVAE
jgi:D-glycero-beta-D-manno-heptose-7-phosphate kinase